MDIVSFDGATSSGIWSGFQVLVNDGTGGFSAGPLSPLPIGGGYGVIAPLLADVTGDGRLNLILPRSAGTSSALRVYPGTPAGTFVAFVEVPIVDGDGERDAAGSHVADCWRHNGDVAGIIRQYGSGNQGTGGAVPVLGASGPLRVGSTSAALRGRRGRGGAPALLLAGLQESAIVIQPGVTLHTFPLAAVLPLALGGTAGVGGAGGFDLPVAIAPAFAGITFYLQLAVADPAAPGGHALSNGLKLHFGL